MIDCVESVKDLAVKQSLKQLPDVEIDGCNMDGCNGYVFFGKHQIFRRNIAIKYYYYGESSHEEATLLKNIKHKNILQVWDAHCVEDGWAYFITDKMDNGTLETLICSQQCSTSHAIDIIRGLLSGVGKMHEPPNFLLHRDLKPANILIDNVGSPIIADFGSVKRLPEAMDRVAASQHSALYRPPESYVPGCYLLQSDIFQIGLVMYQLLGGWLSYDPFDYMSPGQKKQCKKLPDSFSQSKFADDILYVKAKNAKLVCIESMPIYTHPKLVAIIKKATHPDYSKRYQNTSEFFLHIHQLGSTPNWKKKSEELICCEYKAVYYRIVRSSKGYLLERSKDGVKWRKPPGVGYEQTERDIYEKAIAIMGR